MPAKIKTARRSSAHRHPVKPRGINTRVFERVYWPYLPVILIIGFLLSVGVRQNSLQMALKHPTGQVLSYATSMAERQLLADTNQLRVQANAPALRQNSQLDAAATAKANDMASRNYWSHDTPDGKQPWVFVTSQNYSYQKLGENLAAGFNNEHSAINGWMASPSHRENLLDPSFTDVGFGVAKISNYTSAGGGPMTIVVAFYGKPADGQPAVTAVKGGFSSKDISLAQLALAKSPIVGLATDLIVLLAAGSIILWLGRHIVVLRRTLVAGERFAITHPFLDIGLIIIAALSYLLSHTAGLIH